MSIRPTTFAEFVGQEPLKRRIQTVIDACLIGRRPLPPILLIAQKGAGKSSFAHIIARESLQPHEYLKAPVDQKHLRYVVEGFEGVVIIDEVHALTRKQQEYLLPVLEDREVVSTFGERLPINVSIVAATTDGDKLIGPLVDRFRVRPPFDPYSDEEMASIVQTMAEKYGMTVNEEWASKLAGATLGVPRNARSLVECARDLMETSNREIPSADEVLAAMRITDTGLSIEHIRYMEMLMNAGGLAGLETMRQLLGMPAGYVEEIEIDLIKQRLLFRTGRGRELSPRARTLVRTFA